MIRTYLFFALLIYFLVGGGETRYILETGFSAKRINPNSGNGIVSNIFKIASE